MDLETTARRTLDRLMIKEVIDSYGAFYDAGRLDEFAKLFAVDAVLDFDPDPGFFPLPARGRDTIVGHMRERYDEVAMTARRRHVTSNIVFEHLDDTSARTQSFLTVVSIEHGKSQPELRATGVYHDVFRKEDERWLIAERRGVLDVDLSSAPASALIVKDPAGRRYANLEEEIVDEIGTELPDAISRYTEIDPEMFRAYRDFRYVLLDQGVIPRKDKLLMVLALLTATKQGNAMGMYAGIARNEGATAAEVRDALRVGILFSGGPGIVAASGTAVKYGSD